MRIDNIFIYSFGKLKGYKLKLNNGLNTIYKENGYGKTTISIFIKAMLYGLTKEERGKYLPWDKPSSFGGEMEVSLDSARFKIVREFDSKREKDDSLKIYSLDSNKEVDLGSTFAEEWFKLNSEGFSRSVFIPDYEIDSFGDNIECRLASLIGGGDDMSSYNDAIKTLDLKAKAIRSSAKKGEIISLENDLARIDDEINSNILRIKSLDNVEAGIKAIEKERDSLIERKASLKDRLNLVEGSIDKRIKAAIMERLKGEISSKRIDINNINNKINNRLDINELNKYKDKAIEHDKLSLNRLDIKRPDDSDIREVRTLYNNIKGNKRKKISTGLIITSVILIILGIALTLLFMGKSTLAYSGIVTALIGVLFFIVGISFKGSSRDSERLREILAKYKIYKESLDEAVYMLEALSDDSKDKRINELKNDLDLYFSRFNLVGSSYNDKIIELEGLYQERKLLISDINLKINEYNSYLKINTKDEESYNIKDINKEIEEIDTRLDILAKDLGVLKSKLSKADDINSVIEDLESKRDEAEDKLKLLNDDLRILNLAKDYLKRANDKILNLYLKPMKESLDKYLILIKEIDTYTVDTSFKLTIDTKNGGKDISLMSRGLRGIIYFLMRLALVDILFDREKPFIILDDPFINLDDDNLKIALNLLKRVALDKQVIYFTCLKERCIN